jgi:hypothetical protein
MKKQNRFKQPFFDLVPDGVLEMKKYRAGQRICCSFGCRDLSGLRISGGEPERRALNT